ncbi:MAG TPA: PGPGW domain-containing protein [Gemmatimonadales bacterium]|nr:PGPGW domain-containing protein [Gemmatimonadales bacterium]
MKGKRGRKLTVGLAGSLTVLLGIVLVPLPGPGSLLILGGLAMLRREFPAAGRLLDRIPAPGPLRAFKGTPPEDDPPPASP